MSKMGQELEKRLDENKYVMWEALQELRKWLQDEDIEVRGKGLYEYFGVSDTMKKVDKVLAKIEGK